MGVKIKKKTSIIIKKIKIKKINIQQNHTLVSNRFTSTINGLMTQANGISKISEEYI